MESPSSQDLLSAHQPKPEHIIFLHEKLARRKCDRYLLNLALAFNHLGHKVTFYTSHYNKCEPIDDFRFLDKIIVKYSGWWIPRSILGFFRSNMSILKAMCMAFRLVFCPPEHKPSLVVLDLSMISLYILHFFTKYRLYYVQSFEEMRNRQDLCEHVMHNPSLFEAKFIKLADEVIVESASFAELFRKSFPVAKDPVVLYPAIDIGLWNEQEIEIQRIIPDLLDNTILFLSIGKYRKSSNFKLALDAFEILLQLIADTDTTKRFQLVIAGNCKTFDEELYYSELVCLTKERICASQITFLTKLPIIHEKTLILESAIMIYPSKSDIQGEFLLKAMSMGKPIVALNRGIAPKIIQNRVTGITTEPDPNAMAQVLKKLMMSPHLQTFMGEIAKDTFQKKYSFKSFCTNLSDIIFNNKLPASVKPSVKSVVGVEY